MVEPVNPRRGGKFFSLINLCCLVFFFVLLFFPNCFCKVSNLLYQCRTVQVIYIVNYFFTKHVKFENSIAKRKGVA